MTYEALIQMAQEAAAFAYAPYSNFAVGAALLCEDGTVYTGCNVENASFGAGICAERVALCKAISEGKRNFSVLAVAAQSEAYCTPCGICRQMLWEFAKEILLLCANKEGNYMVYSLKDLLPFAFDGTNLENV